MTLLVILIGVWLIAIELAVLIVGLRSWRDAERDQDGPPGVV